MGRDKYVQVGGSGAGSLMKWTELGQTLEGVWKGTHPGRFGDLGTIQLESGKAVDFPVHTALVDKLKRIKVGAEVFIEYLGKVKGKAGTEYKDFYVGVDTAENISEEEVPF